MDHAWGRSCTRVVAPEFWITEFFAHDKGGTSSVHHHTHWFQTIVVVKGIVVVELFRDCNHQVEARILHAGDAMRIAPRVIHRLRVEAEAHGVEIYVPVHPNPPQTPLDDIYRMIPGAIAPAPPENC